VWNIGHEFAEPEAMVCIVTVVDNDIDLKADGVIVCSLEDVSVVVEL
jgi:hypothetical protein